MFSQGLNTWISMMDTHPLIVSVLVFNAVMWMGFCRVGINAFCGRSVFCNLPVMNQAADWPELWRMCSGCRLLTTKEKCGTDEDVLQFQLHLYKRDQFITFEHRHFHIMIKGSFTLFSASTPQTKNFTFIPVNGCTETQYVEPKPMGSLQKLDFLTEEK